MISKGDFSPGLNTSTSLKVKLESRILPEGSRNVATISTNSLGSGEVFCSSPTTWREPILSM
ncbi:MAG TPA: hypothetical protein VFY68_01360 [Nitrososphaeraceae archaeon]|nr:hypothetical protein [Nitrososphaeraceae archaeon]